jgi:hypothetical protein
MDIVFGDCMSLGGFRYALLLVDVATRYTWLYGLQTVSSGDIIFALDAFRADAGAYPKKFHANFDPRNKIITSLYFTLLYFTLLVLYLPYSKFWS